MTKDLLKNRQNLLIAVAILLFLAVLYRYTPLSLILPGSADEISRAEYTVAKYQKRLAQKETLQQRMLVLTKRVAKAENGLLRGKTAALAAVDLQNRLAAIASGSDVDITSQRVLHPPPFTEDEKPPYLEIPVQITMTLTIRQLGQVLHGIAASTAYLKVHEATVNISHKDKKFLQAILTVSGVMTDAEV